MTVNFTCVDTSPDSVLPTNTDWVYTSATVRLENTTPSLRFVTLQLRVRTADSGFGTLVEQSSFYVDGGVTRNVRIAGAYRDGIPGSEADILMFKTSDDYAGSGP